MFLAVTLLATLLTTPSFSSEIVSAPIAQALPTDIPGRPFTVAKTTDGFVAAWSGVDDTSVSRIFVAQLDQTAHAVGSAHAFGINANYPSLAVDGDRVVLGWLEGTNGHYREVVSALDPDLAGGTPVLSGLVASTVIVGARDGHTYVMIDDAVYDYLGSSLLSGAHLAQPPDSAVFLPGTVMYSAHRSQVQSRFCGFGGCFTSGATRYILYLGHDGAVPMTQTFDQDPNAHRTAIGFGNNGTGLLAWYDGSFGGGGSVAAVRFTPPQITLDDPLSPLILGKFGPSYRAAQPSIAFDGERYLVVWQVQDPSLKFNVQAATVDLDGNVTQLSFPPSPVSETNAVAVAVAPGRFLIAYQIEGADTRIGGRFIDFHSKPYAVRH